MALGYPIQIRLSAEQQAIYEDEAARLNKPLATYLRERLDSGDRDRAELDMLRQELSTGLCEIRKVIEDHCAGTQTQPTSIMHTSDGVLLEILLMLREIGGPERMRRTQAELKRQDFEVWTLKEGQ